MPHFRRLSFLLTRALMALVLFGTASAAQFGNFTYTDNGASITITGYTGLPSGTLSIPSAISGKPVTEIGNWAFRKLFGVTAITFPASITKIGDHAFDECTGLLSITLPTGLKTIEDFLFYGCVSLKSVTLPAALTTIRDGAFYNCGALQSLSLPGSISYFDANAFSGSGIKTFYVAADNLHFTSINGVIYSKSLTTLQRYPPGNTYSSYVVPAGVTSIGQDAFRGNPYLKYLTLPSGFNAIGTGAFHSCASLTGINLPLGITTINDYAFYRCTSLASITLPIGVKSIGYCSFYECAKLATITFSNDLTTIDDFAFYGCGISAIAIPASVTNVGFEPFPECKKLTSIAVDSNNTKYSSVDGVLFNKSRTTLVKYPAARAGSYRIPHGVVTVGDYSFSGASGLTSVRLPSSVTSIGSEAFYDCTSLSRVTIPSVVDFLGTRAFGSCDAMQQVIFTGNAPTVFLSPFSLMPPGFSVGYYNNRTGFTSPMWQGYPTVNLGDWIDTPQDLKVEQTPGGELVDSGAVTALAATAIGSSSVATLTLTNMGNTDLSGISITKGGAASGDYQVSALNTDYLIGGESTTFQITFSPKASGPRSAAIQIASSDADENPFTLTLSGIGTAPEIDIQQPAGSSVADGGLRDFGSLTVGASRKLTFTIANSGTSGLTGLSTSITGTHATDFVLSSAPAATVAKDESTTFVVDFIPTAAGVRLAILRVMSNDSDENPYDIHLTGTGVAVPEIAIELPPGSGLKDGLTKKSFGTVKVGKTGKAKTFILKNTGTAKLTGLKLTRSGKDKKDFIVSKLSKTQLSPGDSTSFKVEFKPTAKGTSTAAIQIESNDADENPFDIKLSGAGAAK
jgi:hypothetical protein